MPSRHKFILGFSSLFLVSLFFSGEAKAGLFPTEVTIKEKTPECLDVYAGGVTGSGTGITIANNCETSISIENIAEDSVFSWISSNEGYDIYLSNVETRALKDRYDFTPNGFDPRYVMFRWEDTGQNCSHKDPYKSICKSVSVAPQETLLIFGPEHFIIRGTPGLTVRGSSYPKPIPMNPEKPFGSMGYLKD